jgi:hypothetical protein
MRSSVLIPIQLIIHRQVFNWLWPPLVQERLDIYRDYWNNHRLSSQKKKVLPTGTSPRQMWLSPGTTRASARNCSIRINTETVQRLRDGIGGIEGHEEAFRFVDAEFAAEADDALAELGYPQITLSSAWDIFIAVVDILST